LFPWPLGVWLLVTRRFRTLALATAIGLVALFAAWAMIGFDGMAQYPRMLSEVSFIQEGRADSLVAVLLAIGVSVHLATVAALGAAAGLLGLAWRFARRPGGDAQAFGMAVIAALTATPIVWDHYMVLLFVPIALISPRLSALWLVPVCTPLLLVISDAIVPFGGSVDGVNDDSVRAAALWLVLEAIVTWRVCGMRSTAPEGEPASTGPGNRAHPQWAAAATLAPARLMSAGARFKCTSAMSRVRASRL
ncbi:MAG TPA: glycosyltransferase 87 family protein, partial [Solirubrobacteraceae bacterium]